MVSAHLNIVQSLEVLLGLGINIKSLGLAQAKLLHPSRCHFVKEAFLKKWQGEKDYQLTQFSNKLFLF